MFCVKLSLYRGWNSPGWDVNHCFVATKRCAWPPFQGGSLLLCQFFDVKKIKALKNLYCEQLKKPEKAKLLQQDPTCPMYSKVTYCITCDPCDSCPTSNVIYRHEGQVLHEFPCCVNMRTWVYCSPVMLQSEKNPKIFIHLEEERLDCRVGRYVGRLWIGG